METELRKAGYVRCPNNWERWYPGSFGMKQPPRHDVFLQGEAVVLHPVWWNVGTDIYFATVAEYLAWVDENGVIVYPGPNVYD